jgi:hypothetical protein
MLKGEQTMAMNNIITTRNPYDNDTALKEMERIVNDAIVKASTFELPKLTINTDSLKEAVTTTKSDEAVKLPEKWIWVDGYKGTNKDMQGHGNYQFEIGKRYDMPLDTEIRDCHAGFHLSLNLKDVFKHYRVGNSNRFFKVRALVRERDYNNYGKTDMEWGWLVGGVKDKLVSQSIEFVRELTPDEVLRDTEAANWSFEHKRIAMINGLDAASRVVKTDELVELGYSRAFAAHVVKRGAYETAKAVASQPDLSMDMKALMIMNW